MNRLLGRGGQHRAGLYRESGTVARTNNRVPVHRTAGQSAAVVATHVLDRVKAVAKMEYRDRRTVHIHDAVRSWSEFVRGGDIDPIGHRVYNIPSCSLAASVMRSLVHGGSQTSSTAAALTPGTALTASSTVAGKVWATGQPGAVSVICTRTSPCGSISSA